MAKNRSRDLTQGPILKGIAAFALPLLGISIVQQLYNTVDLLYVGNLVGKQASASLGISSLLVACLVGFSSGMAVGSNVLVARLFGEKRLDKVDNAIHVSILFALILGLVMAVAGFFFAPVYVQLMGTPAELVEGANIYLSIYMISVVFLIVYNMTAGVFRALGDSTSPLMAQVVGGLANVAMDGILIGACGMGLAGAAWASVVSQGIPVAMLLVRLSRVDAPYRFRASNFRWHAGYVGDVVRVGVPTGLQSLVITLSNVFIQYQINTLGTESITAFTEYFKVELPIYYAILAIGQASITFVAQNSAAGKEERARKGTRICILSAGALAAILAALLIGFGYWAFWIFNRDPEVIALGQSIIAVSFPFYWLYAPLEVLADSTRARGNSLGPTLIIMFVMCVFRTILLFALMAANPAATTAVSVFPISWAVAAACLYGCYRWTLAREEKRQRECSPSAV
jgi:putative MATE family efflux protein